MEENNTTTEETTTSSTEKGEADESIKQYNKEIKDLQFQMEKITELDSDIKKMMAKNEKRKQRYKRRVAQLTSCGPNPEKWHSAELAETKRELEKAVFKVTESVFDSGLPTEDFIPCFVTVKIDPEDEESDKQYELRWDLLRETLPNAVEKLNATHPKFVYSVETVLSPQPECVYCRPEEKEIHVCRAQNGLIRIKKEGVKIQEDCLPENNEEEEPLATVAEEEEEKVTTKEEEQQQ